MFEARFDQGALIKKLVSALAELVTDANFDVDADGITLQAMDSSHVCLVSARIKGDALGHYRADHPLTLGINLPRLAKVLRCSGKDDMVSLRAADDASTLGIVCESASGDCVSEFEFTLMDIDAEQLTIPEQDYVARVRMPSSEYARIMKDLASIGDSVTIAVTKEGARFSTTGDVGTAHVLCKHAAGRADGAGATVIELTEPIKLSFALRHLNSFAKAAPLADVVQIGMTADMPVAVEFPLGASDVGFVRYYLAPKIDDEEEMYDGAPAGDDD